MIRIIDGNAVGAAFLEFVLCAVVGLAELGNKGSLSIILLPIALIALVALVQKLRGTVFDLHGGTIRFHSFWLRRCVSLSRHPRCKLRVRHTGFANASDVRDLRQQAASRSF